MKYYFTLIILLIVGYNLLFASLFNEGFHKVTVKNIKETVCVQNFGSPYAESKEIYFEEEEKDDEQTTDYLSTLLCIDLKECFFIPKKSYSSIPEQFLFSSFSGSQYILHCVFRI